MAVDINSENPFLPMIGVGARQAEIDAAAAAQEQQMLANPNMMGFLQASQAGTNFRKQMLDRGIGMSSADRKALRQQSVLKEVAEVEAQNITDGMDPLDAKEASLRKAMSTLLSNGDVDAANSLMPALYALQSQREQLNKLKAETYKNEAAGDKDVIDAKIARLKEIRDSGKYPHEIEKIEAEIARLEADARRLDRMPVVKPGAGELGPSEFAAKVYGKATAREHQNMIGGAFGLYRTMEELSRWYDSPDRARAASEAGAWTNEGGQLLSGFMEFVKGSTPTDWASRRTIEGSVVGELVDEEAQKPEFKQMAASLGMSVTQYKSLVINAAYAMARAADPGGRLSDNDFHFAVQQLGAVRDPDSAKAAFAAIAERGYQRVYEYLDGYNSEDIQRAYSEQLGRLEDLRTRFVQKRGKGTVQGEFASEQVRRGSRSTSRSGSSAAVEGEDEGPVDLPPLGSYEGLFD